MAVKWITGLNPEIIAEKIEQIKKIRSDGGIEFVGLEFDQYESILHSMLSTQKMYQISKRKGLLGKLLKALARKG